MSGRSDLQTQPSPHRSGRFNEILPCGASEIHFCDYTGNSRFTDWDDSAEHDAGRASRTIRSFANQLQVESIQSRRFAVHVTFVHDWLTGMRGGEKCLEQFC